MLRNNNQHVIYRLAKKSLRSNKKSYGIIFFTIALATFMLFSILSIGFTYINLQERQTIRLQGSDYDILLLNGFHEQQKNDLLKDSRISFAGVEAYSGYAIKTDADDTLHTGFIYSDAIFWNHQKAKAITKMTGSYPTEIDEIMVTKEALEDCKKASLNIGDSFYITYANKQGTFEKEFKISGFWEGFGAKQVFYVSKAFYDASGYRLEDNGILSITLKNDYTLPNTIDTIASNIQLDERQIVQINQNTRNSFYVLLSTLAMVLVICMSAYVLIYNILNISLASKTQYFGHLQTLGMSKRQLRSMLHWQMTLLSMLSIFIGMLLGCLILYTLLPYIMKNFGIKEQNMGMDYYPLFAMITIIIICMTLYVGCKKPINIACRLSPFEAFTHQNTKRKIKKTFTPTRNLSWRMAINALLIDKKKTMRILISLTMCLSVFLCLTTIIDSHGRRTQMENFLGGNLVIRNDSALQEDSNRTTQIMDTSFITAIKETNGVKKVHMLYGTKAYIPFESDVMKTWMKKHSAIFNETPYDETLQLYNEHPETYYSYIKGIGEQEFDTLNRTLEQPIDKQLFLKGEQCLLYHSGLNLSNDDIQNKTISFTLPNKDTNYTTTIADQVYEGYYGATRNIGPTLIVSQSFLDNICTEQIALSMTIEYEQDFDEVCENKILALMNKSAYANDFSYDSEIDNWKSVKETQGSMMQVGMLISILLFVIGILNYVNTIQSTIQNRKLSFTIMESLGMSKSEIRRTLMKEGFLYASITLLLTSTIGVGITYVFFQSMNSTNTPFVLPLPTLLLAYTSILGICSIIPIVTNKQHSHQDSIIEKLRNVE